MVDSRKMKNIDSNNANNVSNNENIDSNNAKDDSNNANNVSNTVNSKDEMQFYGKTHCNIVKHIAILRIKKE